MAKNHCSDRLGIDYNMDENTTIALERQNPWWFEKPFDTGIDRLQWYPKIIKYLNTTIPSP